MPLEKLGHGQLCEPGQVTSLPWVPISSSINEAYRPADPKGSCLWFWLFRAVILGAGASSGWKDFQLHTVVIGNIIELVVTTLS